MTGSLALLSGNLVTFLPGTGMTLVPASVPLGEVGACRVFSCQPTGHGRRNLTLLGAQAGSTQMLLNILNASG